MKTLNLTNKVESEINYKHDKYPDGQSQITITKIPNIEKGETKIRVISRLNNFIDLEILICAVKSLNNIGIHDISLYCPLILGSRSDRKFEIGSNNYLKQVITPVINSLGFTEIRVYDPHSDVLEACLNNFEKDDNSELVDWALVDISSNGFVLISPDAGANKKVYSLAEKIGYTGDIITCTKIRGLKGEILRSEIILKPEHMDKDLIIVDDILDFGGTFVKISDAITAISPTIKKYLIVSHAIQDKGLENTASYFNKIYTTNSSKERSDTASLKILNIINK